MLWITAIFSTSTILKDTWDNGIMWLDRIENGIIFSWIYYLLPFVIPTVLLLSLVFISVGFQRKYD